MNGVSCPGSKKSCDMDIGLATCVCLFLGGGKGEVLDHTTAFSLRCIDKQHNNVVKNMGTEVRLPGSPTS